MKQPVNPFLFYHLKSRGIQKWKEVEINCQEQGLYKCSKSAIFQQ